jgi:predicted permease
MLDAILQDLRYALRGFRRSPGFALTVVLTLALGTGANVAIFSVVDHVLIRPLPVPALDQLVNLSSPGPKTGSVSASSGIGPTSNVFSCPLFRDLERAQTVFTGVAAHRNFDANVAFKGQASDEAGWLVSGSYFPVLALQPALGRLLMSDDDRAVGAHHVTVLSHEYWRTRFNADPAVLNEGLVVNGQLMTIVGVAPPDFVSTTLDDRPQIFVPLSMASLMRPDWNGFDNRRDHWLYLFARLNPGVSREDAERTINVPFTAIMSDIELGAQRSGLSEPAREEFARRRLLLEPGGQGQRPERAGLSRLALLLFCVTGIVLLMACANVANLLLARGVYRTTELTMRMSVGASRGRVVRHLLIESCLLAAIGGIVGVMLAVWTLGVITPLLPGAVTFQFEFNTTMFIFTVLVSGGTALLMGLYPALHSTRRDFSTALKGSATSSGSIAAARFRAILTTTQIALSLALLVLAGLFTKSLLNVGRLDLGIHPDKLLTFRISPELSGYTRDRARVLAERIDGELAALPGVRSAAISTIPLLEGFGWSTNVTLEGSEAARESPYTADVGPDYFRTVGIPLVAGREFVASDDTRAPKVAIVNEAFVRAFKLGQNVVGRRMVVGAGTIQLNIEILGIVMDATYSDSRTPPPPQYYLPYRQIQRFGALNFYVRSTGPAEPLVSSIPALMTRVDRTLPIENLRTMNDQVRAAADTDRSMSTLSTGFATLAILLAAIGLYGVLSYTVEQRRREIGVRMALGADAWRITRLVFGQVGLMALAGSVAGCAAALGLGRLAQSMLFGVEGPDLGVMAGAAIGVIAVVLAAAMLPARRAARVDPMTALRAE